MDDRDLAFEETLMQKQTPCEIVQAVHHNIHVWQV